MEKRRSIVFYMPNLASGGIEKMTLLMAPEFVKAGYKVTLLLQTADGGLINSVPTGIDIVALNCRRTILSLIPLIKYLRQEKPDILFSSYGHNHIIAIWAAFFARTKTKLIISQHNAPSAEIVKGRGLKFSVLLPVLYSLFLRFAHSLVAVSQGVADDLAKISHLTRDKISVIYNPVIAQTFETDLAAPCSHPWLKEGSAPVILGVGRLVELKDFSTLIFAFAKVVKKRPAKLILLGEGHLLNPLKAQAEALGLKDCVDFPGFDPNPYPYMKRAAVLALSSLTEGFGNVLIEAMACGTPVVSTDCKFGPPEILAHGKYGKLVPVGDSDALADGLLDVLTTHLPADVLRKRGMEFTVDKAVNEYLALFERVLTQHP